MSDCIFCKIISGEIPSLKLSEDDDMLVIMDIMPLSEGHCLVIPKKHAETIFDLDDETAMKLMATTRRTASAVRTALSPDGINLLQNNQRAAGQLIPHVHVHVIPRKIADGLPLGSWSAEQSDSEELKITMEKIRSSY